MCGQGGGRKLCICVPPSAEFLEELITIKVKEIIYNKY
jgi:hypothetical protein